MAKQPRLGAIRSIWGTSMHCRTFAPFLGFGLFGVASLQSAFAGPFGLLHSFQGDTDGQEPAVGLTANSTGDLFGSTFGTKKNKNTGKHCSKSCGGNVYSLAGGGLYSFARGPDGEFPNSPLLIDAKGSFFGTADDSNGGIVYHLSLSGRFHLLHSFCNGCGDGSGPSGALVADAAGNMYGTTVGGGLNDGGTVFKIGRDGTTDIVYSFCTQSNCSDGAEPLSGLIADHAGNFYGTTSGGGTQSRGTVFRLTPDGSEAVLHSFCEKKRCADGNAPLAPVIADSQGNLYGTTELGGTFGQDGPYGGVVFKLAPDGSYTVLHSFCEAPPNCPDGYELRDGLTMDSSGNLYGVAYYGGRVSRECNSELGDYFGCGTVFRIAPDGSFTTLVTFTGQKNGNNPVGTLLLQDSYLYGLTFVGGAYDLGTVFRRRIQ
jgi:uncharacterized repeat protein (TIGR03803 family)